MPIDRFANEIPHYGGHVGEVVTMQATDHPRLAASLLTVLERERKIMAESMATVRAKDFAEYLNRMGQIEGLDIAISHTKAQASKLG